MSAARSTVLVTPRSFPASLLGDLESGAGEVRFRPGAGRDRDRLLREVADVDGWIAGLDPIDGELLDRAPRLQVIARYGVGVETIELEAAAARGVVVTNTPGANADSVAEFTVLLMMTLLRRLPEAAASAQERRWDRVGGRTLSGRDVGLIGLGAVGGRVALHCTGLGAKVFATDPAVTRSDAATLLDRTALLARSELVSLHAPVLPDTRDLADAAFFAAMRPGAFLVNTARGELVREADLAAALDSGHLAGAALDDLRQDPPPANHPLLGRPDVMVTPHIAAHTDQAATAMGEAAVRECLAVLDGRAPQHPVLPREGEAARG